MRKALIFGILLLILLMATGCGNRVFISEQRLRGPVPDAAEAGAEAAAQVVNTGPTGDEAAIMAELVNLVGEDLTARATFSGRETPRSRPVRGARVEPGDFIRVSASRAQETALIGEEYCQEGGTICSKVWVYGRPNGGTQGAWYPIVIFEYELPQ